ncbi:LysR family transcriptional regulator [Ramlibacter sp. AN1015]|uniref:LysR family transcriptional regulator n=1 Tax=Ramlibacter sp. AN1015 TaxID=3133428 RepID=UPI0030BD3AC6
MTVGARKADPKLHHFKALVEVVDSGGIRAAARRLGVTQAALAKRMQALEEAAGQPLLIHRHGGVTPTEAGEALLRHARFILRKLTSLEAELAMLKGEPGGRVAVSVTPAIAGKRLHRVVAAFRADHPGIRLVLGQSTTGVALAGLRDGSRDLAVIDEPGELDAQLAAHPLAAIAQVPVVRTDHPILRHPTAEALSRLQWIKSRMPDGLEAGRLRAAFRAAGVSPPEQIIDCDPLIAMALVGESDAVALVPESSLPELVAGGLAPVRAPGLHLPSRRHALVALSGVALTAPAASFRECLLQVYGAAGNQVYPRWE